MTAPLSSVFPRPSAADSDDVVWTLQTAAVQWQRGLRADAIVWVRRAADTATEIGQGTRAEELRDYAARLAEFLWSDPEEVIDPSLLPQGGSSLPAELGDDDFIDDDEIEDEIEVEELEAYEGAVTEAAPPQDAFAEPGPTLAEEETTPVDDDDEVTQIPRDSAATLSVLPDYLELEQAETDVLSPSEARDSFLSVSPEAEEGELGADSRYPSESSRPRSEAPTVEEFDTLVPPRRARAVGPPPSTRAAFASRGVPEAQSVASPVAEPSAAALRRRDSVRLPTLPLPPIAQPSPLPSASPSHSPPVSDRLPSDITELSREAAPLATEVDGVRLESVDGLGDLPEDAQGFVCQAAELRALARGEALPLGADGIALVTSGAAVVRSMLAEIIAARVGVGGVVAARGSLRAGLPLRLVAMEDGTRVALWQAHELAGTLADYPWVLDELRQMADRLQARAGAGLGSLGERLDDGLREAVYDRLEVRVFEPGELVLGKGQAPPGLILLTWGELSIAGAGGDNEVRPGEFVFATNVMSATVSPGDVRAGAAGALSLFAPRPVAHELMMSVPPLLEILAG